MCHPESKLSVLLGWVEREIPERQEQGEILGILELEEREVAVENRQVALLVLALVESEEQPELALTAIFRQQIGQVVLRDPLRLLCRAIHQAELGRRV